MTKREITAEELAWLVAMAQKYPDLRKIGDELRELDELRERVKTLQAQLVGGAGQIEPKSVSDLLKLNKAGFLNRAAVVERLGLSAESPSELAATPATRPGALQKILWNGNKPR